MVPTLREPFLKKYFTVTDEETIRGTNLEKLPHHQPLHR